MALGRVYLNCFWQHCALLILHRSWKISLIAFLQNYICSRKILPKISASVNLLLNFLKVYVYFSIYIYLYIICFALKAFVTKNTLSIILVHLSSVIPPFFTWAALPWMFFSCQKKLLLPNFVVGNNGEQHRFFFSSFISRIQSSLWSNKTTYFTCLWEKQFTASRASTFVFS